MSALLAIDIGNSTIGLGIFPDPAKNTKLFIKKIPTHPVLSVEAYKKIIGEFIKSIGDSRRKVSANHYAVSNKKRSAYCLLPTAYCRFDSIISSVVPPIDRPIIEATKEICGKKPLVLSHKSVNSIAFEVSKPSEVGADRIANAVAGLHCTGIGTAEKPQALSRQNAVAIVDVGTATTITVCAVTDEKQRFIGGAILPGIELMLQSLYSGTSKLPLAVLKKPGTALGKSTVSSIISGIVCGTAGAVEHLIKSMEKETGFELKLVLTGGHAGLISSLIKRKHRLVPELTFYGLRLIYLKAKSGKQCAKEPSCIN